MKRSIFIILGLLFLYCISTINLDRSSPFPQRLNASLRRIAVVFLEKSLVEDSQGEFYISNRQASEFLSSYFIRTNVLETLEVNKIILLVSKDSFLKRKGGDIDLRLCLISTNPESGDLEYSFFPSQGSETFDSSAASGYKLFKYEIK